MTAPQGARARIVRRTATRLGELPEHLHRLLPADAGVGDALPVGERLPLDDVLASGDQVALDHHPHHRVLAGGDLARHVAADDALALGPLGAVRVAEVDHQPGPMAGRVEHRGSRPDVPGLVVRRLAAAQDDVGVLVAGGLEDPRAGVLRERQEDVGMLRGADRVHGELDASAGAVLEPDRAGQPRGHLAVHLALGGARADRPPTDQVRDVLGG